MKVLMIILFTMNVIVALINYFTDDLLRAIWYLLFAIIVLICDLVRKVAENE